MKRLVNGVEVELLAGQASVSTGSDRLYVRTSSGTSSALAVRQGDLITVSYQGQIYRVEKPSVIGLKGPGPASGQMHAPMPGLIVDVLVSEGEQVTKGQKLLVLEAMKTQQPFTSPFDGTVTEVKVSAGDQVAEGAPLIKVEAAAAE